MVIPRDDPPHQITTDEKFDLQAPSGDLPRWLRPNFDGFKPMGKYLRADDDKMSEIARRYEKFGSGLKIGISWHSGISKRVSLEHWGEIFAISGVQFISLQYGDHGDEIKLANKKFGVDIFDDLAVDPMSDMDTFAAQVAVMDAVITIDNSTLAVAAGLDIPTFALIPQMADWRYVSPDGANCWHACLHTFRQDAAGNWSDAVHALTYGFQQFLAER